VKVALIRDRLDPTAGGEEQWTAAFIRFLATRGHEVHVIAFGQAVNDLPATTHLVEAKGSALSRGNRIARVLATLAPDVVHDTGTSWFGDVFHPQTGSRRLSQSRLVATQPPLRRLRAAVSPPSVARRWQMAWLEHRQVQRAGRIVAVSRLVRSELMRQHGLAEAAVEVVPNGVDTARFAPNRLAPLRQDMRAEIGVGDATLFVLSAHNLHLKGVDTAMRALALLGHEGTQAWLAVAGGVPDESWLNLAAQLGVRKRVSFLGPIAQMEALFAAADVAVHPTRWDACSLSTIEAAAAGLPVITTAANGAAELIEDGQTGFVMPNAENAAALAARMQSLLNPALRETIGRAALAASPAHDIRHNLESVETMLRQIVERKAAQTSRP
jgi:UDP-glucose:(heptosyl)LPS alpha-1,3-glucosyltransferase